MANALYGMGRQNWVAGNIDWDANVIKCVLVDAADYTLSIDVDDALADIVAGARVATSGALASKTNVLGTCDAADATFTAATGDVSEYVVVYVDSGVEATSYLLACYATATGLPVTPNGGDITVQWNASGLFTI